MTQQSKTKYGLFILRRDQDHILVLETDNYDKSFELWKQTKEQWSLCVKEQKPFELTTPIVTAFDPGLISEVTIRPIMDSSSNQNNPYVQKMQREGFGNAFSNKGDILDSGYKY